MRCSHTHTHTRSGHVYHLLRPQAFLQSATIGNAPVVVIRARDRPHHDRSALSRLANCSMRAASLWWPYSPTPCGRCKGYQRVLQVYDCAHSFPPCRSHVLARPQHAPKPPTKAKETASWLNKLRGDQAPPSPHPATPTVCLEEDVQ